jgi:hypothetical protein
VSLSGPRWTGSVGDVVYDTAASGHRGPGLKHFAVLILASYWRETRRRHPGRWISPFHYGRRCAHRGVHQSAWKSMAKDHGLASKTFCSPLPFVNQGSRRLADQKCAECMPLTEGRTAPIESPLGVESAMRGGSDGFPGSDSATLFTRDSPFADIHPLNPPGIQKRENFVAFARTED